MPHFYNHEKTKDFGKVSVTPKGIRYFRFWGYSPFPYVTMSKVLFTLRVEKIPQFSQNIYMQLGDGSYRTIDTISKNETFVSGEARYTGDTKFFICSSTYTDRNSERFIAKEGLLLFEDNVQHINNYIFGGCSVSALIITISGVLLAWLLGIIQINPTWIAHFNP
jgi:hypothetical protein